MKIKKSFAKYLIAVLATALIAAPFCAVPSVAAVSYEGSGTASSPYLVKTAEQLNGIRNNLSANYKLANTIDMASFGELAPIGMLSRPFTGSFVCDISENGAPKYIIKNLTVYNHAGETNHHTFNTVQSDYAKDNSKWETALFGATSGSTLKGIYILNANITSTVIGQEDMNNDYSLNYGQKDEQGTAVLIGIAKSTTVSNCYADGTITSASNCNGGLVGEALSSCSFKNCGANVEINTSGIYYSGGFIGKMETGTVTGCFSTGSITLTKSNGVAVHHMGGFVCRCNDTTVSNCYSTGSIPEGQSFILSANSGTQFNKCYAVGGVNGTKNDWSEAAVSECYVSNDAACYQPDFSASVKAGILSAFSGAKGWNTSGTELPVLSGVAIVKADDYKPEAVSASVDKGGHSGQSGSEPVKDGTSASGETASTDEIIELVKSLPDNVDDITIDMKDTIKKAKRACDNLSDSDYSKLPTEVLGKISSIYDAFCPLLLSDVAERIGDLPDVKKLTSKDVDKVLELYDDYEFLPADIQSMLSSELKNKLTAAKKAADKLSGTGDADVLVVKPEHNQSETILIIVLSVIAILMLAGEAFIIIMVVHEVKAHSEKQDEITKDEI